MKINKKKQSVTKRSEKKYEVNCKPRTVLCSNNKSKRIETAAVTRLANKGLDSIEKLETVIVAKRQHGRQRAHWRI